MPNHELGFGGVGASGMGRYGGKLGYINFSNPKSITERYAIDVWPINTFAPPLN